MTEQVELSIVAVAQVVRRDPQDIAVNNRSRLAGLTRPAVTALDQHNNAVPEQVPVVVAINDQLHHCIVVANQADGHDAVIKAV